MDAGGPDPISRLGQSKPDTPLSTPPPCGRRALAANAGRRPAQKAKAFAPRRASHTGARSKPDQLKNQTRPPSTPLPVGGAPSRRMQATPASKAKAFAPRRASHTGARSNPDQLKNQTRPLSTPPPRGRRALAANAGNACQQSQSLRPEAGLPHRSKIKPPRGECGSHRYSVGPIRRC